MRAGAESANLTVPSDAFDHRNLLAFVNRTAGGRRLCAIEGTGSFSRGLTTYVLEKGEAGVRDRSTRATSSWKRGQDR